MQILGHPENDSYTLDFVAYSYLSAWPLTGAMLCNA